MILIPPEISLKVPSSAERRLHKMLRQTGLEGWTALHSVGLSEHDYKVVGEIDFLLLGPKGIFVLEVKGGRIAHEDGKWVFTDRFGHQHRKAEGPFNQASSAMFALKGRLEKLLPVEMLKNVPFMWGVVFPDIIFNIQSVEWAAAQVIDKQNTPNPARLATSINRLADYAWHRREQQNKRNKELTKTHITTIIEKIRPDFERLPVLQTIVSNISLQTAKATTDQYRYLDACTASRRLLCTGGAGTGKTFLAVESARRESLAERSVHIVSRSPVLAGFIRAQVGMNNEYITVSPFSQVNQSPKKVDCLIIDEAQDLMNIECLAKLDDLLQGGLEGGRWRIFLDENHQTDVLGEYEPESAEILTKFAENSIHLPENCRNTEEIIREVTSALQVDIGRHNAGNGPTPVWDWWDTPEEGSKRLSCHIKQLLSDGVPPNSITVLTGDAPTDDALIKSLPNQEKANMAFLTQTNINSPPTGCVSAVRLDLFKGLESNFIFVTSLPSDARSVPERLRNALYVAMTRPRAGLFILLPSTIKSQIETLAIKE
jgi:hypothetical protein